MRNAYRKQPCRCWGRQSDVENISKACKVASNLLLYLLPNVFTKAEIRH